nr:MAG TPA: hypothetical protein [Bacteriophage sp.]
MPYISAVSRSALRHLQQCEYLRSRFRAADCLSALHCGTAV